MIIDALAFLGNGRYKSQTPLQLIKQMDEWCVNQTIVAPVEEGITVYNDEANRETLLAVEKYPGRLRGYAVANPWYGEKAVRMLRDAFANGLSAVYFDSSLQGFAISDELVYPLIDLCGEFERPAYFHTGTPAYALPMQLHFLAGVFPTVQFIMGHCGANDFAGDALPALYHRSNLWLETSMTLTVSQHAFLSGAENRVIFGSAGPRSALSHELSKTRYACAGNRTLEEKVLSGNIRRLFGGAL